MLCIKRKTPDEIAFTKLDLAPLNRSTPCVRVGQEMEAQMAGKRYKANEIINKLRGHIPNLTV
jgi:hypothetical protein